MTKPNALTIDIESKMAFPDISASNIISVGDEKINQISSAVEGQYANIADRLLANYKLADAGILGDQLNQLISTAREFDPSKFKKKGILSKIINAISGVKDQVLAHSDSVNERIERVVKEIDKQIILHENRQSDLDGLMIYNKQYHVQLTENIEKSKVLLAKLIEKKEEIDAQIDNADTFSATDSFAFQNQINRVKALGEEFENNRLRSKQVGIEIETMKQTGVSLIQTVKVAKQSLIPNWKLALIQYIMSLEQKNTASYVSSLHEANNEALRALGSQIGQNAENAARLMNSQSVTIETLEELNNKIIETGKNVEQIQKEADAKRIENAQKREALEKNLRNSIV